MGRHLEEDGGGSIFSVSGRPKLKLTTEEGKKLLTKDRRPKF